MMEQEYVISNGYKIFYTVIATLILGFALFLISSLTLGNKVVIIIPILMSCGGVLILVNTFKRKIIISEDNVAMVNIFSTRSLACNDIKGIRWSSKRIIIESKTPSESSIVIRGYDDFTNSEDISKWLTTNFKDLDVYDREADKERILNDANLGSTEKDRQAKLDKARQFALAYIIWGAISGLITIFLNNKFMSVFTGMVYPLLGIVLMKYSYGLNKFIVSTNKSARLGLIFGFLVPAGTMLIGTLIKYNLLSFANGWIPALIIAAIMFGLLYVTGIDRSPEAAKGQVFGMIFSALLYGFGTIAMLNCQFDSSNPQEFTSSVEREYTTTGKGAHYHVVIAAWQPGQQSHEIDVSRNVFYNTPVGMPVKVDVMQGFLHIPWFYTDL